MPFLQSAAAKPVLMCAIAACSLDHKEANASVMKFVTEFVKASKTKDVSIAAVRIPTGHDHSTHPIALKVILGAGRVEILIPGMHFSYLMIMQEE